MNLLNLLASYSYSYSYGYDDYSTSAASTAAAGLIIGALMLPLIIAAVIGVIAIIAQWKIFTKAGEAGWKSIIPIYNVITLFQIVNINPLFILVALIPIVGGIGMAIISIVAIIRLCKGFGKSDGFIVGCVLLSFIFMLILAFDKSTWNPAGINMESFSFLNKEKGPVAAAAAPAPGVAPAPGAAPAPTTTPEDPWVAGNNQQPQA